ncbi:hypothetical protein CHS0354_025874 [Potamilus streckersoni]|uniref:Secreted protein n=1 Tax=Potamilus streckersoni TaxID=2493646 RepID=A0AAE0TJ42_9BIVA|nr:hypothetical protein CHS0354_025874 [Potamilus streckersoni]
MKGTYIAVLAVLLCCHVLLVQSNESQRGAREGNKKRNKSANESQIGARAGNNKGNKSAKKEKPSAGMDVAPPFWGHDSADATHEVPAHAQHNTDVEPIVMSALFDDQTSAGDISATTQTPLLKPGKGNGEKTKGSKNKGKNSKPVNANEKEGEKSKNKKKPGARKPNRSSRKPGRGTTN